MKTIRAIYENGVFRPLEAVELSEHSVVEFEPREVEPKGTDSDQAPMRRIYEILSRRYHGGEPDIAARHDEHQP
jgi:predicted DNA-binding antitoxin AbrB/MazE fold protein